MTIAQVSERSERTIITGSPRSGEQLTGAPPVSLLDRPHGHGAPVSGVPVEELVPFALAGAGGIVAFLRAGRMSAFRGDRRRRVPAAGPNDRPSHGRRVVRRSWAVAFARFPQLIDVPDLSDAWRRWA